MIWNLINTVLIAIVGIGAIFFRAYMKEKGKNLATKEDIGRITGEIESVRSQFEVVVHTEKEIFSKEYSLLEKVWELTWELQARARKLRPMNDVLPIEDLEACKAIEKQRIEDYAKSMQDFIEGVIKKRPFIPEGVYEVIMKLRETVVKEQTRAQMLHTNIGTDKPLEGLENVRIFDDLIEELNESIRSHVFGHSIISKGR